MDVSIIIVSWNTRALLATCLKSVIREAAQLRTEVILVDNASTDGSPAMVREQFPGVRLVENQANRGFASANNQGIRLASGRCVLLLNPDTEMKPGSLASLVGYMDANPRAGAAGSRLLNPDGSLQASSYPFPSLGRELWRLLHLDRLRPLGVYEMHAWDMTRPRPVEVIQGASLMLRKAALEQVGLLDEDYFIYTEEVDLCYRLQKAGWELAYVPQSQVVHYGGQSTQQVAGEMFLHLYKSKLIFIRKHYGWGAAQLYKLVLLLASLVRLALSPLAYLEKAPQRERHLKLAHNYQRLIAALPGL
jgi:hypothetical protein